MTISTKNPSDTLSQSYWVGHRLNLPLKESLHAIGTSLHSSFIRFLMEHVSERTPEWMEVVLLGVDADGVVVSGVAAGVGCEC